MKQTNSGLTSDLRIARGNFQVQQTQLKNLQGQYNTLQPKYNALLKGSGERSNEVEAKLKELTSLKETLPAKDAEIQKLKQSFAGLTGVLEDIKREKLVPAKEECKACAEAASKATDEDPSKLLEKEVKDHRDTKQLLEKSNQDKEASDAKLQELKISYDDLKKLNDTTVGALQGNNENLETAKQKRSDAEKISKGLQEQLSSLQETRQSELGVVEQHKSDVAAKQKALDEAQAEIHKLKQQIAKRPELSDKRPSKRSHAEFQGSPGSKSSNIWSRYSTTMAKYYDSIEPEGIVEPSKAYYEIARCFAGEDCQQNFDEFCHLDMPDWYCLLEVTNLTSDSWTPLEGETCLSCKVLKTASACVQVRRTFGTTRYRIVNQKSIT